MNILEVRNLNKSFKKNKQSIQVLQDLNVNVVKGETLALVGESGCGKSTMGRILVGLTKSDSGEIVFNDIDISKGIKRLQRSDIQIIFQDPFGSLNPRISIKKILIEAIKCNREINKKKYVDKAIELIEIVGLKKEDLQKYPHEFSGGQRQRITIARAIATNPKLIICDEPVSALDLLIQAQMLNLLNDLKNKYNFTYIFISHNLSVVRHISDRVAIMNDGKIVELEETEEIFNNPKDSYTKLLLNSILKIR